MAWGQEMGADVKISALRACQYEIFDFVPCSLPLKTLILLTFSCFLIRRRGTGVLFLCTGRRGDVASPPTGDLPHPSVGRGPRAPLGSMHIARRDTWVPPYESYCAPFGAEHYRQADVGADDPVRPNSAKRCHSEPVTVSLAWESVPLVPYLLTTSRPSDQTETMLCRCVM